MTALRRTVLRLGLDLPIRKLFGGTGAIIMLHRIDERGWMAEPGMSFTPSLLLQVIRSLRRAGYEIVSLDEALNRIVANGPRFACLTFDDGYRYHHDLLWPLLRREGAPATIYLATGFIDGSHRPWWTLLEALIATHDAIKIDGSLCRAREGAEKDALYRQLRARLAPDPHRARRLAGWAERNGSSLAALSHALFLDWDATRAMARDGLISFGAHTVSHPRLSALSDDQANWEIVESGRRIAAELGAAPRHFAFPFGTTADSGPREARLVAAAGYVSAVHARGGPLVGRPHPMALPRIPLGGDDDATDLAIRLSGLGDALRRLAARSTSRAARWAPRRPPLRQPSPRQ